MMIARFLSVLAVAAADIEGLHLLQTSAHAQVSRHNSSGCESAKDALKAARQSKNAECADEPVDFVEPASPQDKYKIYELGPNETDPSSFKSCNQGWMGHVTQHHFNGDQCWQVGSEVTGPLGRYKMVQAEMNHLTPDMCLQFIEKIIRMTGVCNPKAGGPAGLLTGGNAYRFTGCSAEFDDGSTHDVMQTPPHLLEEWKFNNLRGHAKFGTCMLCGRGRLGPFTWQGNMYQGKYEVPEGVAQLFEGIEDVPVRRMTCILNPEEKDKFQLFKVPLGNGKPWSSKLER